MNLLEKAISEVLNIDSLLEAEKITGLSYKESEVTSQLGLALHLKNNEDKNALLTLNGDTTHSNKVDRYLEITTGLGFKIVLEEPFESESYKEKLFILYHPEGILLNFDTFGETSVNGGQYSYNWKPHSWSEFSKFKGCITSSGNWNSKEDLFDDQSDKSDYIWSGYHDCREAIKYHISLLKEHGNFINPWQHCNYLNIMNYKDWKSPGYLASSADSWQESFKYSDNLTKNRIRKCPKEVQDMVGVWLNKD